MRRAGLIGAVIYLGISVIVAVLFLSVTLAGDYSWVARIGGSIWVFSLSNIVLMPLVIPWVKRRFES